MTTSYLLERAWVDGAVHDDVLVEIEDGRFTPGRASPDDAPVTSSGVSPVPVNSPLARPHHPRPGQLPQPRLPPGAAGADPARAGDVLDLARADVRRRRAARPRTPTSRWPARRTARWSRPGSPRWASSTTCTTSPTGRRTTTRTRWAHALRRGRARGRDPDHAARHLLPHQRVRRRRPRACRCATPTATRERWAARGAGRRVRRRSTRCGRCRATSCRSFHGPGAAARPPLRAGRRERGLPGGVRRHPDPAAARGRPARPGHDGRARHPPDRRRHRAARRPPAPSSASRPTTERDLADGIGPAQPAARRRLPDHARQRQPRGDRPVRGDARAGDGRAAGHPGARPLDRRRAARRRHRPRSLGSRRGGSRSAPGPTWSPSTPRARAPPAPAPTSTPRSSPPPAPTSPRWSSTAGSSSRRGDEARSAASSTRRSEHCGRPP